MQTMKKRMEADFQKGEAVWVYTRFMLPRGSSEFQPRVIGPFSIIKSFLDKVANHLDLPASIPQQPHFSVRRAYPKIRF